MIINLLFSLSFSSSGASVVAIDNKIEQAMVRILSYITLTVLVNSFDMCVNAALCKRNPRQLLFGKGLNALRYYTERISGWHKNACMQVLLCAFEYKSSSTLVKKGTFPRIHAPAGLYIRGGRGVLLCHGCRAMTSGLQAPRFGKARVHTPSPLPCINTH